MSQSQLDQFDATIQTLCADLINAQEAPPSALVGSFQMDRLVVKAYALLWDIKEPPSLWTARFFDGAVEIDTAMPALRIGLTIDDNVLNSKGRVPRSEFEENLETECQPQLRIIQNTYPNARIVISQAPHVVWANGYTSAEDDIAKHLRAIVSDVEATTIANRTTPVYPAPKHPRL